MEIVTFLVLGADSLEREHLLHALLCEFGSLGVFEIDHACEAIPLLNETLVDAVVVVRATDNLKWEFVHSWMQSIPGWRDIPYCVAADAKDCRELRHELAARWLAASAFDD